MDWNTWGPPLAVLALGAVAGLVMGLRTRGASASADPREVLLARKAQLIEAIRSLELERDKHDPADYASRREALVSEAAEVLRAIEEPAPAPEPAATGGAGGVGVIWALVSAGFIGLAAFVMVQSTSERTDGGMGGAAASAPTAGPMQEAMATLESDPDNLGALNQAVHYAILGRDVETAMKFMDRARTVDESDPEVQTHLAALQLMVGMFDRTDETLDKLLAEHPDFSEALIWKAIALIQRDRFDEARPVLERVMETAERSDDRAAAASILADMAQLEAGGGAAASGEPSAGEPTTRAGSAASPEAARVAGTLILPDGASVPAGARLFVYVRSAAAERGPPLAAIRVDNPGFPLHFSLAEGDLIRGGDWPDEVWIKARIPAGGDPMARSPEDWESALIGPIAAGTRDVELSLEPPS